MTGPNISLTFDVAFRYTKCWSEPGWFDSQLYQAAEEPAGSTVVYLPLGVHWDASVSDCERPDRVRLPDENARPLRPVRLHVRQTAGRAQLYASTDSTSASWLDFLARVVLQVRLPSPMLALSSDPDYVRSQVSVAKVHVLSDSVGGLGLYRDSRIWPGLCVSEFSGQRRLAHAACHQP